MVHVVGKLENKVSRCDSCLLLGYRLSYDLKPSMRNKYNLEFGNVLFVTETGLDEAPFGACSLVWGMIFRDFPEVHESRVTSTSASMIGEGADTTYVLLKVEAFRMLAEFSIIRDFDLVVTKVETSVEYINGNKWTIWISWNASRYGGARPPTDPVVCGGGEGPMWATQAVEMWPNDKTRLVREVCKHLNRETNDSLMALDPQSAASVFYGLVRAAPTSDEEYLFR